MNIVHKIFTRMSENHEERIKERIRVVPIPLCTTRETLEECLCLVEAGRSGAYFRFGDGDVYIAQGGEDMLQENNPQMTREMIEAFSVGGNGILKALPLNSPRFGVEPGMRPGVHLSTDERSEIFLARCFPYFLGNKIYNACALHHQAVMDTDYCITFLKAMRAKTSLFVGCGDVEESVRARVFGNAHHVKTPTKNSYKEIDRICDEALVCLPKGDEFGVVVVAMGCAGRIFIKRMLQYPHNIFYFDFGSLLDALCGWNTRAWIEETNFLKKIQYILDELSQ